MQPAPGTAPSVEASFDDVASRAASLALLGSGPGPGSKEPPPPSGQANLQSAPPLPVDEVPATPPVVVCEVLVATVDERLDAPPAPLDVVPAPRESSNVLTHPHKRASANAPLAARADVPRGHGCWSTSPQWLVLPEPVGKMIQPLEVRGSRAEAPLRVVGSYAVVPAVRRIVAFAMTLACVWIHIAPLSAAPVARRARVVLRVDGALSKAQRDALATLLEVDFRRRNLTLSIETPSGDVREWVDRARTDEQTLLVAVLDASRPGNWQLSIVDASRGRAINRSLVGGVEANAAALEAVASIVSSAASALQDGLEVASKPIDEVVGTKQPNAPVNVPVPVPVPVPDTSPLPPSPKLTLQSSLALATASFSDGAPLTYGLSLSIGFNLSSVSARLFGTGYLPARIDTALGDFNVHRTTAGISVGPTFAWGALELEPEGSVVAELLRRTDAAASVDASTSADRTLHRIGAMIDLRIRYRLGGPFAIEWMAGGAYFGQRVRFLAANPQLSELAVPWPWVVSSQVGLEVRAP